MLKIYKRSRKNNSVKATFATFNKKLNRLQFKRIRREVKGMRIKKSDRVRESNDKDKKKMRGTKKDKRA